MRMAEIIGSKNYKMLVTTVDILNVKNGAAMRAKKSHVSI